MKDKRKITYSFLCIFLSAVIAGLFSFIVDKNTVNIIRTAMHCSSSLSEYVVPLEDIETDDIEIDGELWRLTKDSPTFIIRDLDTQVDCVEILFSEGEAWAMGANLFR